MKIRLQNILVAIGAIIFSHQMVRANEPTEENQSYEWIQSKVVVACEDGFYIDTHKGMTRIEILDYDEENDCYLVNSFPSW